MAEESDFSDFSQPWELSDIILEVEDVQFHVHKPILALWSSVFSTMFQSNFKEKKRHCIPLPGKSAEEFRVLLEVIYPNFQRKIKLKNCTFLLEYAREYMIETLTEKCKTYLEEKFNKTSPTKAQENRVSTVVTILVLAQEYGFSQLEAKCIKELVTVEVTTLRKVHPGYENISRDNRLLILEKRALNLEKDLKQTTEDLNNKKEDLNQTKEDLKQTQKDLEQTKGGLESTKRVLKRTRKDLKQTTEDLENTKGDLKQTTEDLEQSQTREEEVVSRTTHRAKKCFVELIKFVNLCGATLSLSPEFDWGEDPTNVLRFKESLECIRRFDQTGHQDMMIDVEPLEKLHAILQKMI